MNDEQRSNYYGAITVAVIGGVIALGLFISQQSDHMCKLPAGSTVTLTGHDTSGALIELVVTDAYRVRRTSMGWDVERRMKPEVPAPLDRVERVLIEVPTATLPNDKPHWTPRADEPPGVTDEE